MKKVVIILAVFVLCTSLQSQAFRSIFGSKSTSYAIVTSNIDQTLVYTSDYMLNYSDTIWYNGLLFYNCQSYLAQSDDHSMLFRLNYDRNGSHSIDTLMDLNLKIGDSIFLERPQNFLSSNSLMDSYTHVISKYQQNNILVIEFDVLINISDSLQVPLRFIEGLGVNCGEFFNMKYSSPTLILCQTKNDTSSYMDEKLRNCSYNKTGNVSLKSNKNSKIIKTLLLKDNRLQLIFSSEENYTTQISTIDGKIICKTYGNSEFRFTIPNEEKMFILSLYDSKGNYLESHKLLNHK